MIRQRIYLTEEQKADIRERVRRGGRAEADVIRHFIDQSHAHSRLTTASRPSLAHVDGFVCGRKQLDRHALPVRRVPDASFAALLEALDAFIKKRKNQ
jgi:hypothetical protein